MRRYAKGCTALILAIELGRFDAVLALVDRGAKLDYENRHGHTALTMAAAAGKVDVVTALLVNKAAPDHETRDGRTALIHAAMMVWRCKLNR